MIPVKTGETNMTYVGDAEEVLDLPAVIGREDAEGGGSYPTITTVWELDGDERFQLERGGRVALQLITTQPPPPVALAVVGPDCDDCGKPTHWDGRVCMWICSEDDEIEDGNTRSD